VLKTRSLVALLDVLDRTTIALNSRVE
jgi:hypothetical protein